MLLAHAVEQYIAFKRAENLTPKTCSIYRHNLNSFIQFTGKEILPSITTDDLDQYMISLTDTLEPATRQNIAGTLRGFFKYWTARKESNVPWELIAGPKKLKEKLPNVITDDMFDLIDDYLDEEEYSQLRKKLVFNLLWNTGMRIGELLSINIADINIQKRYLTIQSLKSKRLRVVVWNEYCHQLLVKYLGVRLTLSKQPELFESEHGMRMGKGTRLTARTVQRWCKELERELGFKMNPHAFRHGKAHHILHQGGNQENIKTALGHVSIHASDSYTRLNGQEQLKLQTPFLPKRPHRPSRGVYPHTLVTEQSLH